MFIEKETATITAHRAQPVPRRQRLRPLSQLLWEIEWGLLLGTFGVLVALVLIWLLLAASGVLLFPVVP